MLKVQNIISSKTAYMYFNQKPKNNKLFMVILVLFLLFEEKIVSIQVILSSSDERV